MNARNSAIQQAAKDYQVNYGDEETDYYNRKIRQINKFDNYFKEQLAKIVGTKVAIILYDDVNKISYPTFTIGTIKSMKNIKNHVYQIECLVANEYGKDKNTYPLSIKVDLTKVSYKPNEYELEGITDNGQLANIKLSNKKARLAIAGLFNRKGDDEYLKPIK